MFLLKNSLQSMNARSAFFLLAASLCALLALPGCGGKPPMTPQEFLITEQMLLGQEDFTKLEEIDFGKFKATHVDPVRRTSTIVQFNIWAVIRPGKADEIKVTYEAHRQRIRDSVIVVIQNAQFDQLTEPSLKSLKHDLMPVFREALRTSDFRDLVLDDFKLNTT